MILDEMKALEVRLVAKINDSEERIREDIKNRHYKEREEIIRNSYRVSRELLLSAEDVKGAAAKDNNRVLREVYETVAETGENVVRRTKASVKQVVKDEVRGSYFSPEVRNAVGFRELQRIAGSRVAQEWRNSTPTESIFHETDKILRNLDQTVRSANSTLVAAETTLAIMRHRMMSIRKEAHDMMKNDVDEKKEDEEKKDDEENK